MATLHIMDRRLGDKRIQYDKSNKKDIKKAEKLFKQKLKEGWIAIGYKAKDTVGQLIRKFDPAFNRIVMRMPMAGG